MKSGLTIRGVLALSPELWVGALPDYCPSYISAFKQMVELRAWDPMTKANWFPISYLPHVKQLIREHKCASNKALDDAHQVILAETARRTAIKRNTDIDGNLNPQLAAAYDMLCLHPNAPRMLVEWAIVYWRREAGQMAVPATQMMKVEEAYRIICAGGL